MAASQNRHPVCHIGVGVKVKHGFSAFGFAAGRASGDGLPQSAEVLGSWQVWMNSFLELVAELS